MPASASQPKYLRRLDFSYLPPIKVEINNEIFDFIDYPKIALTYAQECISGRNWVCREIVLACKRYIRMLEMAEQDDCEFYFSPLHVIDYCNFAERFSHFESGLWEVTQLNVNGERDPSIRLEPAQIWVESAIQGFRRRGTNARLVNTALEVMPRKNAKSLKATIAALHDLTCSGQLAPEIPIAASTERQADDTLFGDILKMVGNEKDFSEKFKVEATKAEIRAGQGRIFKLSSQGQKQDGLNPSLAIFEEGHAGASDVYKVVDSAFGARPGALRRMITTAGYRSEGPAFDLIRQAKQILYSEGKLEDYTLFAAIYTLDPEDYLDPESKGIDWDKLLSNEALIAKANPMYGVSLDPFSVRSKIREVQTIRKDLRGEIARTRFNIWTTAGLSLIDPKDWEDCRHKIKLTDFIGKKCWIGVDLATFNDMCAIALLFEIEGGRIAMFAKYFLPMGSPTAIESEIADRIQQWNEGGVDAPLVLTEGVLADHDRVKDEIIAYSQVFDVQMIACDPYQAHNTAKQLWDENLNVVVYANSAAAMTGPTDNILGHIANRTLMHDGNPILAWNAANVFGERKPNGSILPRKEHDKSLRKIDGFVAACMANGCRMQPEQSKEPAGVQKPTSGYDGKFVIGGGDE